MRKRKYCDEETVFEHIWNNCDDGMWTGDAATIAAEFKVSEDTAYTVLSEICDGGYIEKVDPSAFAITKWPEDESGEEEVGL
jgi:hypothetical protein